MNRFEVSPDDLVITPPKKEKPSTQPYNKAFSELKNRYRKQPSSGNVGIIDSLFHSKVGGQRFRTIGQKDLIVPQVKEGTCKVGERADLTGCTPAHAGSSGGKLPSKKDRKEESHLMEEAAKGNEHAFARLVKKIQEPLVRNLLKKVNNDHALAEDVAQETLLKLWQHAEVYTPDRDFWPWVMKIAKNIVIDKSRKKKEEAVGGYDEMAEAKEPKASTLTPPQEISERERMAYLEQYIDELPEKQRFVLRGIMNGRSVSDLASELGVVQERGSQLKTAAVARLRELMKDKGLPFYGMKDLQPHIKSLSLAAYHQSL